MTGTTKATIIVSFVILVLVYIFFSIASLISRILNLPSSLNLPVELRVTGVISIGAGVALTLWLFKYRRPQTMIMSTYFTFRKLFRITPIGELSGRVEPLVIRGPQKYVRHPLYLGATIIFFGWGLLTGTTSSLIATVIILLWFGLVQIPFEEKEMLALFGDRYARYMSDTPMLIPFTKNRTRSNPT